jgi:tetratricopeptide (TPR) repeat protein
MRNNMKDWKTIIDQMDAIKYKNNEFRLELVNYQYGYIAWCIGNKKKDEAEKYLNLAQKNIELLNNAKYNLSMINAYKAAFYGFRIGLNSFLAPFVGGKSMDCAKLAMKLDDNNPFGHVQYANVQYYMPSIFGGSKTEALASYLKAKGLMEKNTISIKDDWNYISLLTIIARAYWDLKDMQTAKTYFEKIIKLAGGYEYEWVKKEMYPQLLKEMAKKK